MFNRFFKFGAGLLCAFNLMSAGAVHSLGGNATKLPNGVIVAAWARNQDTGTLPRVICLNWQEHLRNTESDCNFLLCWLMIGDEYVRIIFDYNPDPYANNLNIVVVIVSNSNIVPDDLTRRVRGFKFIEKRTRSDEIHKKTELLIKTSGAGYHATYYICSNADEVRGVLQDSGFPEDEFLMKELPQAPTE
jgi:hypothetical protein